EREETELQRESERLPSVSECTVSLKEKQAAVTQEIKSKQERLDALKTEFADLKKIGIGAPCPKCKQELTTQHYQKVQQDYAKELSELEGKIAELTTKNSGLKSEILETSQIERTLKAKDCK